MDSQLNYHSKFYVIIVILLLPFFDLLFQAGFIRSFDVIHSLKLNHESKLELKGIESKNIKLPTTDI